MQRRWPWVILYKQALMCDSNGKNSGNVALDLAKEFYSDCLNLLKKLVCILIVMIVNAANYSTILVTRSTRTW